MRHLLYTTLLAASVMSAGSVIVSLPVGANGPDCIDDWSVAAPIVRKEGLVAVETLSKAAPAELDGDIVKATLCRNNGTYVFKLVVKGAKGQMRSVTLDARNPFER